MRKERHLQVDDHVSWIPVEKETKIMMLLKVLEVDDHVSLIPVENETKVMMLLKVLEVDDHVSWMHVEKETKIMICYSRSWRWMIMSLGCMWRMRPRE